MEPTIFTRNMKLTPRLQTYVSKKTERLDRYMPNMSELRVDLSSQKARNAQERTIAQITVRDARGTILRAEEQHSEIFAAIDSVVDKMYRQIKRYRGKKRRGRRGSNDSAEMEFEPLPINFDDEEDGNQAIVRRKQFEMQPMSADEAIDQMELLGHDFYLFFNIEEEAINLVYKRKEGQFGLLQPVLE